MPSIGNVTRIAKTSSSDDDILIGSFDCSGYQDVRVAINHYGETSPITVARVEGTLWPDADTDEAETRGWVQLASLQDFSPDGDLSPNTSAAVLVDTRGYQRLRVLASAVSADGSTVCFARCDFAGIGVSR